MNYAGGAVSWQSRLQKVVALSTTKGEYMAEVQVGKELIWMKNFLSDNQSSLHPAKTVAYPCLI